MLLIYELKPASTTGGYSAWEEGITGNSSNWDIDLLSPATNQGGGDDGGGITINNFTLLVDDGGTTGDPAQAGDGNIDAGETFTFEADLGFGPQTYTGLVDYFFSPNANADTSLMTFTVDVNGTTFKYAYNLGNGDPTETDPQKVEGGRITEGMTNQGNTFLTYEERIFVCFVSGSKILTPGGEVLVEHLSVGDTVTTLKNGGQKIRWIGSAVVKARGRFAPVRISAGALDVNVPASDLLVSPAHRMVISGWRAEFLFDQSEILVAAGNLVNDSSIVFQRDSATVEYFHIMFDSHEIVISNGAPSESFNPTVDAITNLAPEARAELLELFPELNNIDVNRTESALPTLNAMEASLLNSIH